MKNLTVVLLFTLFNFSVHGQTLIVKKSKKLDFDDCQKNQNRIYKKVIKETDSQIELLLSTIEENRRTNPNEYHTTDKRYQRLLLKLSLKKIIIQKIRTQFNSRSLSEFMTSEGNRIRDAYDSRGLGKTVKKSEFQEQDFISYENLGIDLNKEVENEIKEILNDNLHGLKEFALEEFKNEIKKEILKESYHLYSKIAAGVFVQMSRQTIKTFVLNIGSSLFISAAKGTIVSILTQPLYGYRYLPEKYWTDLLEEHNELILVPEWMKKAHVGDGSPWRTHCNAIAHRTGYLEESIKSFIAKDNKQFMDSLKIAGFKLDKKSIYQDQVKAIDNTRVRRPIIPLSDAKRFNKK